MKITKKDIVGCLEAKLSQALDAKQAEMLENVFVSEGWKQTEKQIQALEKRISSLNDENDSSGEKRKKAKERLSKLRDHMRTESVVVEEEDLEEISKTTIGSYKKKAFNNLDYHHDRAARAHNNSGYTPNNKAAQKVYGDAETHHLKQADKREKGIKLANKKLAKEETDDKLTTVKIKHTPEFAGKKYPHGYTATIKKDGTHTVKGNKDSKGYKIPARTEEVEDIEELSKSTLGNYVKKAAADIDKQSRSGTLQHVSATARSGHKDAAANRKAGDAHDRKVDNRIAGIGNATRRLTKEDDSDDDWADETDTAVSESLSFKEFLEEARKIVHNGEHIGKIERETKLVWKNPRDSGKRYSTSQRKETHYTATHHKSGRAWTSSNKDDAVNKVKQHHDSAAGKES